MMMMILGVDLTVVTLTWPWQSAPY